MEFPVPGGEQIAWFAKVVRLEEFTPDPWWSEARKKEHETDIIVGVQFHQLPDGHRHAIRTHLQVSFQKMLKDRQSARWKRLQAAMAAHGWRALMYTLAAALAFSILYFLARPTPNYDPSRGSPWGQRFKIGP